MDYAMIVGGLVLLVGGAELLVGGSIAVAKRLGVSPLLIGLTLVGFGTSSPELIASCTAALRGAPGIAVGNVVGSNIVNVLLILGTAAVITPITTTAKAFWRDCPVLVVSALLLVAVAMVGFMDRWIGIAFVVALSSYVYYCYRTERQPGNVQGAMHEAGTDLAESVTGRGGTLAIALGRTLVGFALLILGAYLLVDGGIAIARTFGISESIIGLTVVAAGTSLPELVTTAVAAFRRQADVAFGNVVGSNIYNILGVAGVTAAIQPIPVPSEIVDYDIWVMLAATLLLTLFAFTGLRINRWEGAALLVGYAAYMIVLFGQTAPVAPS